MVKNYLGCIAMAILDVTTPYLGVVCHYTPISVIIVQNTTSKAIWNNQKSPHLKYQFQQNPLACSRPCPGYPSILF